jgi:phosphohistidine phosphatase
MLADAIRYPLDKIRYREAVYLTDKDVLLQVIRTMDDSVNQAMLIGHNPGLTELANYLGDQPIDNIPTGGICRMDFRIASWKDVREHGGKLRFIEFPGKHAS